MPNTPRSIGFIMDGNRRWARERNLPTLEGHRVGAKKVLDVCRWAKELGVPEILFYAFSTENWNRSDAEVGYLMSLFEEFFKDGIDELRASNVQIRFIGDRARARESIQQLMSEIEESTQTGTEGVVTFAFSYGGRAEIMNAVQTLLSTGVTSVTEEEFSQLLWTKGLQDPDLIIRTGGEQRLSNFLTWQSVYSELFFSETKWPDFNEVELSSIIRAYGERERRRGK